ncbi:MAG TPA: IS21 family transposase [Gaiellaceae bacterium]|nr:IS21 family transposase [Gaiellaceae bacterium]
MVTDAQVRLLRHRRMEGKTQEAAAAVAGMSVRTARKWEKGPFPSACKPRRSWRTRRDPFAGDWEAELVPLLESDQAGALESTTLLELLVERHPDRYTAQHLRTLQRRLRDWRALHGPDKEVFFEQVAVPGREGAIDFTHATELGVTIAGELLRHLLFEFVLRWSRWRWVQIAFAETFEALVAGLQGALWDLGAVPEVLRSDNLSAATHELRKTGGRALNARFEAVLDHYRLRSSRIQPGAAHENGVAEQAHDALKSALAQALVLRGSRDFPTVEAYATFVADVVARGNRPHLVRLEEERPHLRPLPTSRIPDYTVSHPRVRRWSTIRVGGRTYSVPARLIGHVVDVHQHPDVVEVFYRDQLVEQMPRLHGLRDARIDYRHVIWSLVRKPGAFARYRYREDLFPSLAFRRAYDALRSTRGERGDIEYVRILHLAASTLEATVAQALDTLLARGEPFDYAAVRALAAPAAPAVPRLGLPAPDLGVYDRLLAGRGAR